MNVELFCSRISVYRPSYKKTRQNESHFALGGTAFPLEPRFSREENKRTRGEHQTQANKRREMLCFALLGYTVAQHHFATSRAHSRAPNEEKKGCWAKEASPFVFCSSPAEKSSFLSPPPSVSCSHAHACMHACILKLITNPE